jgi:Chalcone isomerase-like
MLRRLLIAALPALLLALPLAAQAQSAPPAVTEVNGVKFDNEITLRGNKLLLNGAGTRYKFVVKVYAAGLYVPARISTPEAAWDTKTPRAFKVVMLRDIDANELGKLLTDGMQKNATREEFGKAIPGTLKLAELFAAKKKLVAGDNFIIEWAPGIGTSVVINGKPEFEPVKEPEFFSSLMKIWFGKSPADYQLKDALLAVPK